MCSCGWCLPSTSAELHLHRSNVPNFHLSSAREEDQYWLVTHTEHKHVCCEFQVNPTGTVITLHWTQLRSLGVTGAPPRVANKLNRDCEWLQFLLPLIVFPHGNRSYSNLKLDLTINYRILMVSGGVPTNDVQAFMRFWGCAVGGEEPDKDFM